LHAKGRKGSQTSSVQVAGCRRHLRSTVTQCSNNKINGQRLIVEHGRLHRDYSSMMATMTTNTNDDHDSDSVSASPLTTTTEELLHFCTHRYHGESS
jgi:hypothetical protein